MYYVYFLLCSDQSIYCGITNNLEKRVKDHNSNTRGAKYTKTRQPVHLLCCFERPNKSEALKYEYELKQLSKKEKITLIEKTLKARLADIYVEYDEMMKQYNEELDCCYSCRFGDHYFKIVDEEEQIKKSLTKLGISYTRFSF